MHMDYHVNHNDGGLVTCVIIMEGINKDKGKILDTLVLGHCTYLDEMDNFLLTTDPKLKRTTPWRRDTGMPDFPFYTAIAQITA